MFTSKGDSAGDGDSNDNGDGDSDKVGGVR